MRVIMPGLADVLEFQEVGGAWMSESGAVVEIAATMPAENWQDMEDARGTARRRIGLVTGPRNHARAN
jgi:hypothetical protein